MDIVKEFLISMDQFGFAYEFSFSKHSGKFKTKFGGLMTILVNSILLYLIYLQFNLVAYYGNDVI